MAAEMEFCLLGPLIVRRGGVAVAVPPGRQRAALAVLLLNAGRVVRLDKLAETLWGSGPPPSAPVAVQNYVMRLRKTLGDAGRDRIITQSPGYLIRVNAGELDVSSFDGLLSAARAEARDGSWYQAASLAREALRLWRGEPLADVDCEVLAAREVPRLAELRLQALETRIDADLHVGRHAEVIAELRQLTGEHPLREQLHGLLMLALYRDGRQAESLTAYADARRVLVEEIGAEPGTRLRQLHHQMLTADPALEVLELQRPATVVHAVPQQLPAAVGHFTGRASELAALTALLDQAGQRRPGTVVISAIGGTAGVGKTALAVHWAHQVADRFPDGQLYVNLRGYDPGQPMTAADALAGFLRALGVRGHDMPLEVDERSARYRSLLASRRMLVVADNAGSVQQVRPLLPGTPGCVVVVTSRDSLAGLVARDGARRLDLDLLPSEDAVGLLRALIGERVDAEPAAAAALAGYCSRLPLALRIAAEYAVTRSAVSLADLAGDLASQQRRLDLLEVGGDPGTAVRAVFSWSYRRLDAGAARAFRLLGLHPGPGLDRYAVAALTGTTVEAAGQVLSQLARAHLIQPAGIGLHGLHDLLRAYARELAVQENEEERQAALTRLFDHYLQTAAIAMDTQFPAERHHRPSLARPDRLTAPVTGRPAARDWLDAQRANLVAIVAFTAEHGWPGHTARLAAVLFRYLDAGGHYAEAVAIHACACRAARATGDRGAEATALNSLGAIDLRQGRNREAVSHFQRALPIYREAGDRIGEARALGNLGTVDFRQGRYPQAASHCRQALAIWREVGDRTGEGRELGFLGIIGLRQGRYAQADDDLHRALTLSREAGDGFSEAYVLGTLGAVDLRRGRCQQAAGHLKQAMALAREVGDPFAEAFVLGALAAADLRQGRCRHAADHLEQALNLRREAGDRAGESEALNGLGEVFLAAGQPDHARAKHAAALSLASQTGDKYEQARAHYGLGLAGHAARDPGQSRRHWQEALILYGQLGAPEADQVRAQLAVAEDQDHSEQ